MVRNWDELIKRSGIKPDKAKLQNEFPCPQNNFRWGLFAPSGGGKTNLIVDLIMTGKLKFDKLYLFCKNPWEQKYQYIIKTFTDLEKEFKKETGEDTELIVVGTEGEAMPDVDSLNPDLQNLMIIDDFISDRKAMESIISDHFIRGRKMNCSYIVIQQSYFNTPKLIRLNLDNFSLWKQPTKKDVQMVISDHSLDMEYDDLKRIYLEATSEPYCFLHIDKTATEKHMMFRKNLDGFYFPE